MRTLIYYTLEEKKLAIAKAEAQGETQVEDNHFFDDDDKFEYGELLFNIIDNPIIVDTPEEVELEDLRDKMRGDTSTLSNLRRYLVLRDRL